MNYYKPPMSKKACRLFCRNDRHNGVIVSDRSVIVPTTIADKSIDDAPVSAADLDSLYWYGDMDLCRIEVLKAIKPKVECFRYRDNSAGRKKPGRGLLRSSPRPGDGN
jgi:hypothetical protein